MDVNILENASLINDKNSPFGFTVLAQHTVFLSHGSVWPKVTEYGISDATQAFSPGLKTGDVIDTDAQNLDIRPLEPGQVGLVRRDLIRSYGCPCQRKESQDDCLSAQAGKRNIFPQLAGKGKIGGRLPNFEYHAHLPEIRMTY
jgi:hypothetical protein